MGQTKISDYFPTFAIFKHIAGRKTHSIIQQSIDKDEVIQVIISTIEMRHRIICAKASEPKSFLIHLQNLQLTQRERMNS